MSQLFTTVIITDSRGRGIHEYIDNQPTPENQQFVIKVQPGKSLAQLSPTIIDTLNDYDLDRVYCIIYAGICGLTDKTTNKSLGKRVSVLRYQETYRSDKVNTNIDTAKFLKASYGEHINFCSIIPADLTAYFKLHNPSLQVPDYLATEQKALEEDVLAINKALLALNSSVQTNINLCSRAQVKAKKKRQRSGSKIVYRRKARFSYKDFTDGVHFNNKFKEVLFDLILHTSIRDTIAILQAQSGSSSSSESD